jgi:Na+/H+-dicarboxylate symporter
MKLGLWVLAALAAGIVFGALVGEDGTGWPRTAAEAATVLGAIWLDALRMTLVPLIFSILVAAIVRMSETAATGRLARRALVLFLGLVIASGLYATLATDAALALWPIDPDAGKALIASAPGGEEIIANPDLAAWARSLVPTNVIAAAAEDAVLPIVVFASIFGAALTRLPSERAEPLAAFFQAMADAMILIVQWVLMLAPIGVFGLAVSLGLTAGFATLGVLAQYVAIVTGVTIGVVFVAALIGLIFSGIAPARFLSALAPVQVVAASTQSSLASLPAMLHATLGPLGLRPRVAEFVLPLAVAVFRMTSPAANLAVVLFLVHLYGVEPTLWQMAAALAVALLVSISSVGLPGQTSFFASIAPICATLGVPTALLPVLLAVEVIPDVFRTIGNVTADVSATAVLDRMEKKTVA